MSKASELAAVVQSVRDYAIFMLDPHGLVQSWNDGARLLKGYDEAEIIGQSFDRFYADEDRAAGKPQRLLAAALAEGRVEDEGWRVRKDGTRFWADVVITPVLDADGTHVGFIKVTRDLTQRREAAEALRQSEARMRLLIESIKDYAVFMVDVGGDVATWNAGAERIKQYTAAEAIGRNVREFYTPEDRARKLPEQLLATAATEGRVENEGWRVRKDGTRFWADVVVSRIRDDHGELIGFAKVTRDLTERKLAEDQLRGARELAEEQRIASVRANEAIRLRDEFLSIASHELRTPLTSLQLLLESVTRRRDSVDAAGLATRLQRASTSTQRLASLVDSLLDVSRITTGKIQLHRETVELGKLATELVERAQEMARQARSDVRLKIEEDVVGQWDRLRVEQILTNLLSNALKYGAGNPVDIVVGQDGDEAVVRVIDDGPGIKAQDLSRIFERFERAVPMRHYGGLGLGLYIARELVQAHGGTISVASEPGHGATFMVRLPIVAHDAALSGGTLH